MHPPIPYNPASQPERCRSGRTGLTRNQLSLPGDRGFESLPLRQAHPSPTEPEGSAMIGNAWTRAASLGALEDKGRLVFRKAGRQIALFDTPGGVLACNNRCPHEGYPLREGNLDDRCILTCNWHNWKFDLQSGRNLYGGEGLRTYPVEIRGGEVWIDLADPPFAERRAGILASLREAGRTTPTIAWRARSRACTGSAPIPSMRCATPSTGPGSAWSSAGTHAYAGLADWLTLYDEHEGDDETRLACVLEGVAHIADDVLREPRHPFPAAVRAWEEEAFVAAIEREDEGAAVAMLRGGLEAGLGFADFERGPEPRRPRPLQRLRPLADLRDQGGPPHRAPRSRGGPGRSSPLARAQNRVCDPRRPGPRVPALREGARPAGARRRTAPIPHPPTGTSSASGRRSRAPPP